MKSMFLACLITGTLVECGCYSPPPVATVQSPPPPVVAPVPPPTGYVTYVPEDYAWDGYEYVGVSGGQYVYWSGGTWVLADPVIVARFQGWQHHHPEWRRHAMHYHREREELERH